MDKEMPPMEARTGGKVKEYQSTQNGGCPGNGLDGTDDDVSDPGEVTFPLLEFLGQFVQLPKGIVWQAKAQPDKEQEFKFPGRDRSCP